MSADERRTGGDPFEELYRAERAGMVRLAHLITGSNAVADELVQDAFVKVAARLDALVTPAAYLRTTVVNECRQWLRRAGSEERAMARSADREQLDLTPEVDETWAALERLPERRRVALVLRYYADQSDDQIAELLGCRPATVRSLVHRGLASLREVLETDRSDEERPRGGR